MWSINILASWVESVTFLCVSGKKTWTHMVSARVVNVLVKVDPTSCTQSCFLVTGSLRVDRYQVWTGCDGQSSSWILQHRVSVAKDASKADSNWLMYSLWVETFCTLNNLIWFYVSILTGQRLTFVTFEVFQTWVLLDGAFHWQTKQATVNQPLSRCLLRGRYCSGNDVDVFDQ